MVDESLTDDNSNAAISPATMEKLEFFRGDTILAKGKKRRETVLVIITDDTVEDSKIRLNKGLNYSFTYSLLIHRNASCS